MILDFGCGDGKKWDKVEEDVVGIDISLIRLKSATSKIQVVRSDGRFLPFKDGTFVEIISDSVLEHIKDYENALLEIRRVLTAGGVCKLQQPVDNDPIFIVARRAAGSWMGDRIYSRFTSRRLLGEASSLLKVTSVAYVPNSPFAGLFGFFNKKPPRLLRRIDRSYGMVCKRTGLFHWMVVVEARKDDS